MIDSARVPTGYVILQPMNIQVWKNDSAAKSTLLPATATIVVDKQTTAGQIHVQDISLAGLTAATDYQLVAVFTIAVGATS
jgi:hypothetical protein